MESTLTHIRRFLDQHGDRFIIAGSALIFAFFVNFLGVLLTAQEAVAADNCEGMDLMAYYKAEEPETYDKIVSEAEATINGSGIFWKIEAPGKPASWLLGTMHLADPQIARLERKRLDAFETSGTVVVENVEALDKAQAMAAMLENKKLTLYTDGTTLEDRLDQETLGNLREASQKRGMPFAMVKIMRPWMVAASIALPPCEIAAKQSGNPVLDALIVEKAKAEGKNLVGLETIAEQFGAMSAAPESFHLEVLRQTVALGDRSQDVMTTMKKLYLDGDVAMVTPLARSVSPEVYDNPEFEKLADSMIDKRNIHMAERAKAYIDEGGAFIAVGALHLPGEKGLVNLLRKADYTVTRVDENN